MTADEYIAKMHQRVRAEMAEIRQRSFRPFSGERCHECGVLLSSRDSSYICSACEASE
jgi:hypothetical protein